MKDEAFRGLGEIVHEHALARPAQPALVQDETTLTWGALDALMDRVAATGNSLVITKRGRAIVRLVPAQQRPRSIVGALKGHAHIQGDIVSPIDVRWEASC